MIKHMLLLAFLAIFGHEPQAQIPNGGFEMWENEFNYLTPTRWWTNQDTIYTRIERDSISVEGNYSLKILPSVFSSWQGCNSQAGIRINFDSALAANSVLSLYAKSVPQDIAEDSSVYLLIFGFTFNADTVIGGYNWRTETPILEFEKIMIPLPGDHIDEMTIFIYGGSSSHPLDGPCLGRSTSWIDEMTIELATSVSQQNSEEKNDFMIYPNPSTGVVTISGPDKQPINYKLFSLDGKLITSGKIENSQLNIHEQGLYVLKLYVDFDDPAIYSTMVVVLK
jgi:hypothetical protein